MLHRLRRTRSRTHPTIDYHIPRRIDRHSTRSSPRRAKQTSVLIDRRLFKSCIRYSGEGGAGGKDGLNKAKESIELNYSRTASKILTERVACVEV